MKKHTPKIYTANKEPVTADMLATIHALARLTTSQLNRVSGYMQLRTYAANETIYRQGDPPAALFFLLSGSVALYHQEQSGRQDRIHVLAPGESCGHAALLPASPQNETAVAAESARLVALMHADFISLSIEKSEIAILILQGVMEEVLEKAKMAFTAYHGLTNQLTAANIIV